MKKLFSSVVLALTTSATVQAAGFSIDTQAGRATGMGSAVAGFIDDASAVFYNPAGIVQGEGLKIQLGDTFILPRLAVQYEGLEKVTMNPPPSLPPHLYVTYGVTRDLSVALGVFTPFGASTDWPEGWTGQFESTGSQLSTFYFNPQVGYRLNERVRIAAGVQVARATVNLTRNQNFLRDVIGVQLGGGSWAVGGNAGIQVDVVPDLFTAGVSYRSAMKFGFDGRVHFSNVPASLAGSFQDQDVSTDVTMPHSVLMGVGFRPMDTLLIGAEVDWFDHSSIDAIDIEFANGTRNVRPKRWEDRFNYHLGVEWTGVPQWAFRAGLVYDPTPSPTETLTADLPDSDRIKPAVGVGYRFGQFSADLGYQFVLLAKKEARGLGIPTTEMSGSAQVLSFTLGFQM